MSSEPEVPAFRAGMIAIVGRPNVGKSTLLNALVGSHISITSSKPQTTRMRVLAVATRPDDQFVFVDTPGLQHRHTNLLSRRMNAGVGAAIQGVDAIVMVADARGWCDEDEAVLRLLPRPRAQGPLGASQTSSALGDAPASHVVLALNKTDILREKSALLPLMASASQRYPFAAIVPVSAARLWQLDDLLDALRSLLPPGLALFDEDQVTDRSVRFLAAELLREQAFRLLGDELPYGLAVAIDAWEESRARAVVSARILVERESQRAIVIGARGAKLRQIGQKARRAMERLLGKPVYLQTQVRVSPGWSNDARSLDRLGMEAPLRS